MVFVEKRFWQDVGITLKTYRSRILMRSVWFGPFGRPNTMSILKFIPQGMVFVEKHVWQDVGIPLKTYRSRILMRSVWFGPFGHHNTMNTLKFIQEGMVFIEKRFWWAISFASQKASMLPSLEASLPRGASAGIAKRNQFCITNKKAAHVKKIAATPFVVSSFSRQLDDFTKIACSCHAFIDTRQIVQTFCASISRNLLGGHR